MKFTEKSFTVQGLHDPCRHADSRPSSSIRQDSAVTAGIDFIASQRLPLIDKMALVVPRGGSRTSDDTYLLLTLEWLDAASLVAFDKACQNNRRLKSVWLGVICGFPDIAALRGVSYTHFWIRWLIDRGARISSMRVIRSRYDPVSAASFEGISLPGLLSITINGSRDMTDTSVRQIAAGCVHLVSIVIANCQRLSWEAMAAVGQHCRELRSLSIRKCGGVVDGGA